MTWTIENSGEVDTLKTRDKVLTIDGIDENRMAQANPVDVELGDPETMKIFEKNSF